MSSPIDISVSEASVSSLDDLTQQSSELAPLSTLGGAGSPTDCDSSKTDMDTIDEKCKQKKEVKISISSTATTIAAKRKFSGGTAEEPIDLSDDDAPGIPQCAQRPTKRARTTESRVMTPPCELAGDESTSPPCAPGAVASNNTAVLSPPSPLTLTPSTASASKSVSATQAVASNIPELTLPTPPKSKELQNMPELAGCYLAKTSTVEGIEYTNPKKFSLKPAFWKKWEGKQYVMLANHLLAQFDPIPFAKEAGLPVEEVKHVVSALVCNPLYNAEEAKKRGEEGMAEIFNMFQDWGTKVRLWGKAVKDDDRLKAELYGVSPGVVELILDTGSKKSLKKADLSECDVEYLKETLSKEDKVILRSSKVEASE